MTTENQHGHRMSAQIVASILQNKAAQCRRLAHNLREGGFLPHTTASHDAEAMLVNLSRELDDLTRDVQALDRPIHEKEK